MRDSIIVVRIKNVHTFAQLHMQKFDRNKWILATSNRQTVHFIKIINKYASTIIVN